MFDSIIKDRTISINIVEKLGAKLERIENQIKLLTEGKLNTKNGLSKITLDLTKLTKEINIKEFSKIKDDVHNTLNDLLLEVNFDFIQQRIKIRKKVYLNNIKDWISSLDKIVDNYKWAKFISSTKVFNALGVEYVYYEKAKNIPYELILKFYNLYLVTKENFNASDVEGFLIVVADKFNEYYEMDPLIVTDDDVPF